MIKTAAHLENYRDHRHRLKDKRKGGVFQTEEVRAET
jgi:hypothetical protein